MSLPSDPTPTSTFERKQPFAARLHFIPRSLRPVQNTLIRLLRRYFEQASGWVLVTTAGRKTGLPREVLLPCERTADELIVISTYEWRSDWIRNMRRNPQVQITAAGWRIAARAEIVEDVERKRAILAAHPFCVPAPFVALNFLTRTLLRPFAVAFLRRWVSNRPIVLIRPNS
ncbi:MAG TPA: nitroreductase family deazaflavin-dependent oxidoreductase [Candidatus Acidoferrales bacterium]|nr:nitroreductase family deazaflavin-dependent oxidoreductase [Candidatus Acidoferrales bacterium]